MIYTTIFILIICFTSVLQKPLNSTGNTSDHSQSPIPTTRVPRNKPRRNLLQQRSFVLNRKRLWPNALVPYEVDKKFDAWEQMKIQKAIKLFHIVSCVRFVPRTNQKDYVKFVWSKNECHSVLGQVGGAQDITLSDDCLYKPGYRGAVVHEMMHALGFIHEHQRLDRDCYVIVTGYGKSLHNLIQIAGTDSRFPYDFNSIMHYRQRDYLKGIYGEILGTQDFSLSSWDIKKLNYAYCGKPHFCDTNPQKCKEMDEAEKFCKMIPAQNKPRLL